MFSLMRSASSIVLTFITLPSFSFTTGGSSCSQGATTQPFPGLSIFMCVPNARKFSNTNIVAG